MFDVSRGCSVQKIARCLHINIFNGNVVLPEHFPWDRRPPFKDQILADVFRFRSDTDIESAIALAMPKPPRIFGDLWDLIACAELLTNTGKIIAFGSCAIVDGTKMYPYLGTSQGARYIGLKRHELGVSDDYFALLVTSQVTDR